MSNQIIEAAHTLRPDMFGEFMTHVKDGESIFALYQKNGEDCSKEFTKDNVVDEFFSTAFVKECGNATEVTLACNEIFLHCTIPDVDWYNETFKIRHSRMKKAISFYQKRKDNKDEDNYYRRSIACATYEENGNYLDFVEKTVIVTNVNDTLNQLNSWLDKYFKAASEGHIRFNLNYEEGDEKDLSKWKSIDDLVKEGTAVLA